MPRIVPAPMANHILRQVVAGVTDARAQLEADVRVQRVVEDASPDGMVFDPTQSGIR